MTKKQLTDTRTRICERMKEIRIEKGLTQDQVSEATGITRQNIARIEKGRYSVGIDILSKIAAVLECEIEVCAK